MKLVAGLGNPGPRYADTRHNVGTRVVEAFGARCGAVFDRRFESRFAEACFEGERVGLLLPETFMNASGRALAAAVGALEPQALLVVLDDIDLPLGRLRLRPAGSDGGQRGLRDVMAHVAGEVPRLRFGVGRPPLGVAPLDYVLARFEAAEEQVVRASTARAVDAVGVFLRAGLAPAMTWANAAVEVSATPASGERQGG